MAHAAALQSPSISLPAEKAIALLGEKEEVHTFCANTSFFAGADSSREEMAQDIRESGGAMLVFGSHRMALMGHNLLVKSRHGLLYVEVEPHRLAPHLTGEEA